MRVLIQIDGDNFKAGVVNTAKKRKQFRFIDWYKINKFVLEYVSKNPQYKNTQLTHVRTYYYSGEYRDTLLTRIESRLKKSSTDEKTNIQKILEQAQKKKNEQAEFLKRAKNYYYFEVRTKPLQFSPSKLTVFQKGVDVQIAVDLVEFSYKDVFDVVVLLSGDIDLLESVKTAKNLGKHVILFGGNSVTAEDMKREADLFIDLERFDDATMDKFTKNHTKQNGQT